MDANIFLAQATEAEQHRDYAKAEEFLQAAVISERKKNEPHSLALMNILEHFARVTAKHGIQPDKLAQSEELLDSAVQIAAHHYGDAHPVTIKMLLNLAYLADLRGRNARRAALYQRIITALLKQTGQLEMVTQLRATSSAWLS